MSATIEKPMSVLFARQLLRDTSRLPEERVNEARQTVEQFYASRPPAHQRCVACGATGRWSEHSAGDDVAWACSICHAASSLTSDEWRDKRAEQAAAQQAAAKAAEAAVAAQPSPRTVLRERLTALAEAQAAVAKAEAALPAARAAVSAAQERHDRAVEVAETSNVDAAEGLAAAIFEGRKPTDSARAAATARGELSAAVDGLVAAKNATVIIRGKIETAKSALMFATDKVRKSALQVIGSEKLSDLLGSAIAGRAQYIDSIGQLAWLLQQHAIDDAGVRQFVAETGTPPAQWPEARTAGAASCEGYMNALLADASAVI